MSFQCHLEFDYCIHYSNFECLQQCVILLHWSITTNNLYYFLRSDLMPALRYTLEWIYQFVVFQDETHFLFRQCASALISLLAATNSIYGFSERLSLCFSKWFSMATQFGNLEVGHFNIFHNYSLYMPLWVKCNLFTWLVLFPHIIHSSLRWYYLQVVWMQSKFQMLFVISFIHIYQIFWLRPRIIPCASHYRKSQITVVEVSIVLKG